MNNSYSNSENLQKLIDIGIALSKEKNIDKLLEKILIEARKISNSDGGTLYLMIDDNTRLSYNIMHTESKNIYYGGTYDPVPESIYPVKLYKDGKPNMHNACVVCDLKAETINIEDESNKCSKLSGGWNNYGNTGNDGGNNGENFRGKRATSRGGFGMGGGGQGGDNGGGGGGGYSGGASGCDGGNGWGGGGGGSYMWTGNPKYAGSSSNIGLNTGSTGGGTGWGYVKVTLKSV